ncbi:centromere associated protein [Fusarium mundagurra]|uniref:Centromere associated protein n=1 Tax=Fusarium mundagurra TaxID=1567541 RepID=A0A8H6D1I5_9HYPO|nr:centromere associated protein [Fusarium mundagurra]
MAPRGARRSEVAEPQAIYKLGERGRKTGVELIDTGNRDEYGMQPLDDLLSSPLEKEAGSDQRYDDEDEAPRNDQYDSEDDEDEAGSEDMDIETSAIANACNHTMH